MLHNFKQEKHGNTFLLPTSLVVFRESTLCVMTRMEYKFYTSQPLSISHYTEALKFGENGSHPWTQRRMVYSPRREGCITKLPGSQYITQREHAPLRIFFLIEMTYIRVNI